MVPVAQHEVGARAVGNLQIDLAARSQPARQVSHKRLEPGDVLHDVVGHDDVEGAPKGGMRSGRVAPHEVGIQAALPEVDLRKGEEPLVDVDPGHARAALGERDQRASVCAAHVEHARPPPASPGPSHMLFDALRQGAAPLVGRGRVLEVHVQARVVVEAAKVLGEGFEEGAVLGSAEARKALRDDPRSRRETRLPCGDSGIGPGHAAAEDSVFRREVAARRHMRETGGVSIAPVREPSNRISPA
jgi:hypothetical protein